MENLKSPAPKSIWASKPWWCQPWSIILTGVFIITGSWLLFNSLWLSGLVATPIALWWYYFLIAYPKLYQTIEN